MAFSTTNYYLTSKFVTSFGMIKSHTPLRAVILLDHVRDQLGADSSPTNTPSSRESTNATRRKFPTSIYRSLCAFSLIISLQNLLSSLICTISYRVNLSISSSQLDVPGEIKLTQSIHPVPHLELRSRTRKHSARRVWRSASSLSLQQ